MSWQEIKHFPSARSMADADGEQKQVTVKLHTRLPAQFRVPLHPLAVPAQLTRFGLSEVVNSLLKLGATQYTPRHCSRLAPTTR